MVDVCSDIIGVARSRLASAVLRMAAEAARAVEATMANADLYAFGSVLSEVGRGFLQVVGPSMRSTENLAKAS